ncbi:MAG: helix-hairpin-helix domain-containing protein, partial [Candidatus Paceibacterota bacterium]
MLLLALPVSAYAALININTADAVLLDTLPGIGPTYASRIVDYRTQHGPFARIEDIQNVSGIGPSTYDNIKSLITVADASGATSTATSSPASPAASYVPPPSELSLSIRGPDTAVLGVPLRLSAQASMKNGVVDSSAQIVWSFGDGSSSTGSEVEKIYRYAGAYPITAIATDGSARARDELVVSVRSAEVRLLPVSGEGITIVNDAGERLDLSSWR